MYRHHRQQRTKIPANGHLSKGRSAAIACTATEIAQYEEAVENDANPGMPCCFDSRKSASRDGYAIATTMPMDPPPLGGRRLAMPGTTGRYKTGRSPISAHIHGKLNREEGNPQKLRDESPQHALRATAKNRPPTLLLASSSISTKCCLTRSASCDDVGNLKSSCYDKDLAGARLGVSTAGAAAAAAARRREQGVPALLRREHQEFGSSINGTRTRTMTIKTRSKQNAGGKGDASNGKGRSGRGGPEDGRPGGQKKVEQRAPKTPTRPKGKRGAVATPKGASKPDQNKPRAGGTTPDGRKATAPGRLGRTRSEEPSDFSHCRSENPCSSTDCKASLTGRHRM